jgi:uncharacterized Zn finger protein
MSNLKKFSEVLVLSVVMFGSGVISATVIFSYLPTVNATPKVFTQKLKQESTTVVIDEERNLKLELQGCKRVNQKVICNFLITSLANKNRTIEFSGHGAQSQQSRIIDDSGNEYVPEQVQVGSNKHSSAQQAELIPNIPTKVSLTFEIPQQVTKFAVIETYISAYGYDNIPVQLQFRDVNLIGFQASNLGSNCTCPTQTNPRKR